MFPLTRVPFWNSLFFEPQPVRFSEALRLQRLGWRRAQDPRPALLSARSDARDEQTAQVPTLRRRSLSSQLALLLGNR